MSHANLLLYGAATPSYDTGDKKNKTEDLEWGGKLDYDNPDNFIDNTNERVRI